MAKKKMTADEIVGELGKLEAERKPLLAKRDANRKKKVPVQKIEEECNKGLAGLNTRIKELKAEYPQAKALQEAEEAGEVRVGDLQAIREEIDKLAGENKSLKEKIAALEKANAALK